MNRAREKGTFLAVSVLKKKATPINLSWHLYQGYKVQVKVMYQIQNNEKEHSQSEFPNVVIYIP